MTDNNVTIMTVNEVAEMLKLKPSTVYRHASDGTIPCIRVGRNYRFSKEVIEAWLSQENLNE